MKNTSKYTKEELLAVLHGENVPYINFTKSNGEKRKMKCTKNFKYIAEQFHPKKDETKKPAKENTDVITVFDVENNGWRSFRVDSVIDYGFEN